MSIKLIEHIHEKGSTPINEDCLLLKDTLFGVFDGATSLDSPGVSNQETGGLMAARTAMESFSINQFPLAQSGEMANQAIDFKMKEAGVSIDKVWNRWSTSAAVVRLQNDQLEWFQTGDANILLIYRDGSSKTLVDIVDHDFETLSMIKELEDKSFSNPGLMAQLQKVRSQMNISYGVLNGDPGAAHFMKSGFLNLKGIEQILLFTDGLSIPSSNPEKTRNYDEMTKLFKQFGLKELHKKIRLLEAKDPDRNQYPRFKCHDDIAAIAIHLEPAV